MKKKKLRTNHQSSPIRSFFEQQIAASCMIRSFWKFFVIFVKISKTFEKRKTDGGSKTTKNRGPKKTQKRGLIRRGGAMFLWKGATSSIYLGGGGWGHFSEYTKIPKMAIFDVFLTFFHFFRILGVTPQNSKNFKNRSHPSMKEKTFLEWLIVLFDQSSDRICVNKTSPPSIVTARLTKWWRLHKHRNEFRIRHKKRMASEDGVTFRCPTWLWSIDGVPAFWG